MGIPVTYKFDDHYQNDGLSSFNLTLTYDDAGTPVDLTGASVKMQLKVNDSKTPSFEFSTESGTLSLLAGGVIQFNEINSWTLNPGTYKYDLQVIDNTGFVRTYLKGTWTVVADITK